jgi:choline dehydrogenase-like flavoprotein
MKRHQALINKATLTGGLTMLPAWAYGWTKSAVLPSGTYLTYRQQNDDKIVKHYHEQLSEMFTLTGFKNINSTDSWHAPGADIHEMVGVRIGKDLKTSLLNKWNQLHTCKNIFVTDGACMTSTATQNPSLTYMALTARVADYAISELKKKNL